MIIPFYVMLSFITWVGCSDLWLCRLSMADTVCGIESEVFGVGYVVFLVVTRECCFNYILIGFFSYWSGEAKHSHAALFDYKAVLSESVFTSLNQYSIAFLLPTQPQLKALRSIMCLYLISFTTKIWEYKNIFLLTLLCQLISQLI